MVSILFRAVLYFDLYSGHWFFKHFHFFLLFSLVMKRKFSKCHGSQLELLYSLIIMQFDLFSLILCGWIVAYFLSLPVVLLLSHHRPRDVALLIIWTGFWLRCCSFPDSLKCRYCVREIWRGALSQSLRITYHFN